MIVIGLLIILSCNPKNDKFSEEEVYSDEDVYNDVMLSLLDSNRYFFVNKNLLMDSIHLVYTLPLDLKLVLSDTLISLSEESILSYVQIADECKELVNQKIDISKLKIPEPYIAMNREDCSGENECVILTLSRICINPETLSGYFVASFFRTGDFALLDKIVIKKDGENWVIDEIINKRMH